MTNDERKLMIITTKSKSYEAIRFTGTSESAQEVLDFVSADRKASFATGSSEMRPYHDPIPPLKNHVLHLFSKKYRLKYKEKAKSAIERHKETFNRILDVQINTPHGTLIARNGDYFVHDGENISVLTQSELDSLRG